MAFDAFVKIDDIDGESSDDKHPNWIEIIAFDSRLNQKASSTSSSAGGASVGRVNFKEFTFFKLVDVATPALALACADGTHIDTVVLELCRAGGEKLKFMEYKLSNCLCMSMFSRLIQDFPKVRVVKVESGENRIGPDPALFLEFYSKVGV